MTKKRYEVPDLIEYGTLEDLTQALSPSGQLGAALALQASTAPSDRKLKEQFVAIDAQTILTRVSKLPIATWNYKAEGQDVRHIGPMAQDFMTLFGVGQDDKHINLVDANGIAFAAIQGLYQRLQ